MDALGEFLRLKREEIGISRNALAKKAGIAETTLRVLESGDDPNPRADTVVKLATALNVTPGELLALAQGMASASDVLRAGAADAKGLTARIERLEQRLATQEGPGPFPRRPFAGETGAGRRLVLDPSAGDVELPHSLGDVGGPRSFVVGVRGDSMELAGIFEGSLALVDPDLRPTHGDVVLAHVSEDETVIKRWVGYEGGGAGGQLWSESRGTYAPIPAEGPVHVLGVVVAHWMPPRVMRR